MKIFNFRELFHLIVIPFLFSHYNFDKHLVIKKLSLGILISFIASLITIEIIPKYNLHSIEIPFFIHLVNIVYLFNRIICLFILIEIVNYYMSPKDNDQFRNWWFKW